MHPKRKQDTPTSLFSSIGYLFFYSWRRRQAGFSRKTAVLDGGFVLSYAEKGQPQRGVPSMVMLHGFSGGLDAAVPVVKVALGKMSQ